jgi:hypothetical protein
VGSAEGENADVVFWVSHVDLEDRVAIAEDFEQFLVLAGNIAAAGYLAGADRRISKVLVRPSFEALGLSGDQLKHWLALAGELTN